MAISVQEINAILEEYNEERQRVEQENYDEQIAEKVKEFEETLRAEYEEKRKREIHEIAISIQAVERIRARAIMAELDKENQVENADYESE